jgi:NADH-quinone oxidoreductase subunit N
MLSLTILAIVTSLIGAYYYFKVIIAMFLNEPTYDTISVPVSHLVLIAILVAQMFALAIFPDFVLSLI